MQSTLLKENKRHGSREYLFEKYDIYSNHTRQFATNHWHDETEIVYVESGNINITIGGAAFSGEPGSIFIINGGEMHEIYGSGSPLSYHAFVFNFSMLCFRAEDFVQQNFIAPVMSKKMQFINHVETAGNAFSLLQHIHEMNTNKPACYMLLTKAALLQFFALMIQANQFTLKQSTSYDNEKKLILKKIILYIDENYPQEITLPQIAGRFNMTHKYFCRFFKNNFKKTFIEYLNDVRIEHAAKRLAENASVTEAAVSSGFGNMSYFTRTFKKKIGCTPSQYVKLSIAGEKQTPQG